MDSFKQCRYNKIIEYINQMDYAMKPYEELAKIYDNDWGMFSTLYIRLINYIINKYNFYPSSILDVACGSGRLACELYKLNYEVHGIDISNDMINIAKSNNPEILFDIADMTDFSINRSFDLITCAFDSMNYLTEEDKILKALANIHSHLDDTGYFIFDINTPGLYEEKHFGTIIREFDDISFKQVLEYNKQTRMATTVFDFGNEDSEVHIQKAYSSIDMDKFLIKSGFRIIERFKDLNFHP